MKYFRVRLSGRAPFLVEADSKETLVANYARSKDKMLLITELSSLTCPLAVEMLNGKPKRPIAQLTENELAAWYAFRDALSRLTKPKDADPELKLILRELQQLMSRDVV